LATPSPTAIFAAFFIVVLFKAVKPCEAAMLPQAVPLSDRQGVA
jgi:hypothetical protein